MAPRTVRLLRCLPATLALSNSVTELNGLQPSLKKRHFFGVGAAAGGVKLTRREKRRKKREEREEREEKEEKEERERRRKREEKEGKERGKESISRKGEGKRGNGGGNEGAVGWAARDEGGHSGAT